MILFMKDLFVVLNLELTESTAIKGDGFEDANDKEGDTKAEDMIEVKELKDERNENPQSIVHMLMYYLFIFLSVLDKLLFLVVIFFAVVACCISCPGAKERRRKESLRRRSLRKGSERRGTEIFE